MLDNISVFIGATGFCLSEDGDLLSQWRGYADNGGGVSIGFSNEYLETLHGPEDAYGVVLRHVIYDTAEQERELAPHIEKMMGQIANGAFRSPVGTVLFPTSDDERKTIEKSYHSLSAMCFALFPLLYTFKNPAFREEREWRLISYATRDQKGFMEHELPHLEFSARDDRIVPYRRIPIGKRSIERVILGPRNITPPSVVATALVKYGFGQVDVTHSEASYR